MSIADLDLSRYKLGWADEEQYVFRPEKGLSSDVVDQMSWWKGEPEWMRQFRLRSLRLFEKKPMAPWFAVNMPDIDFQDIYYYIKPTEAGVVDEWDELPEQMKATYEKLGIPEAERKYLAGVTAQYECLRGDTLVWTTQGMRRIKDLGAGNHPFLVLRDERGEGRQRARYAARWVPAEELQVGDLVAVATDLPEFGRTRPLAARHVHRALGFTNDDLAWFLGLYLGDGFVHHRGSYPSVEIAVDAADEGLVDEIRRVAEEQFGICFELSSRPPSAWPSSPASSTPTARSGRIAPPGTR
jgi:Fe-S cluster assembly protein SufB